MRPLLAASAPSVFAARARGKPAAALALAAGVAAAGTAADCRRRRANCELPPGVRRQDVGVAQLAANAPIEDTYAVRPLGAPDGKALAVAVFDGHGGFAVSTFLAETLLDDLASRLGPPAAGGSDLGNADLVREKVEAAFVASDLQVQERVRRRDISVSCGSCALCVLVDASRVHVANAGDCHAVLVSGGQAIPVSDVHNADQAQERARLERDHPGESDIVVCKRVRQMPDGSSQPSACYVKGFLQPTRAFGDFYLKDPQYLRARRSAATITCPYITSTPEVLSVSRSRGDQALVLATDGLWDRLTDRDAADVVVRLGRKASAQDVADALLAECFRRAAEETRMSEDALRAVPPGQLRRRMHDDITVLVVQL